jgi:hypothetical protein
MTDYLVCLTEDGNTSEFRPESTLISLKKDRKGNPIATFKDGFSCRIGEFRESCLSAALSRLFMKTLVME